jgi:hypothetical protein
MPSRRRARPGGPLRAVGPESPASASTAGTAATGVIARVLVDGRNVQHALAREMGSSLPTAALVAQLRAAFSPPTQIELILDGHPGRGPQGRVTPGLSVVFSRGATADDVIGARVTDAFRELGAVDTWSVLVVTDDRQVRNHARRSGIRVEGTAWLGGRLRGAVRSAGAGTGVARPGTAVGNARPPRASAGPKG